jgi:hypothetical protein
MLRPQRLFERPGLGFRLAEDRRTTADLRIDLLRLGGPAAGDEACERQPDQRRQRDDRRIAEQIAQERLDGLR